MWVTAGAAAAGLAGCGDDAPRAVGERPARPDLPHQPGVVTAPPASACFVAYDLAENAAAAAVVARLMEAGEAPTATVTLAVGASMFDGRFGLAERRPRYLRPMPAFPHDVLDTAQCHGDLLLQVCADTPERVRAVVDGITAAGGAALRQRWRLDGFRPENGVTASGVATSRNLLGFRDGAGNPDPADRTLMDRLVWADSGEPGWAAGGTYAVVRSIRLATRLWDRDAVPEQEAIFGRRRSDGAPLGRSREEEPFDYAGDPDGHVIRLDAHIRRANPRTADSERHRILRRGYSYRRSVPSAAEPDEGLIFVCFQRDPERGFAAIQNRLTGEALQRYVLTFGGGYYFVPPSMRGFRDLLTG
jgi:deferrochelatase/peroxidase EfeB